MKPVRIQRSRQKKQVSPNGLPIVYVGRGSKYGNDFKLGDIVNWEWINVFDKKDYIAYLVKKKTLERDDCIYLFKKYKSFEMAEFAECNRGRNISCWCPLEKKCHGDILLSLWNA